MAWNETDMGRYVPPLLIGLMGPPGGGKTKSALRLATGMQRVRPGDIIVGDTERGRALKYQAGPRNQNGHSFRHFALTPPFKPEMFMDFIREMAKSNPAAIIIDTMSDEHEGEGGYLEWHDEEVPKSGGNEWAAWKKPSASRRKLTTGIQQIGVPVIMTFRAREKTKQIQDGGRKKVIPIGFQPIAPAEVLHTLDLTCLLPPRANGVALWQSPKEGEDFVLKVPEFLAQYIRRGMTLDEAFGENLARWQMGLFDEAPRAGGTRSMEQMVDSYVEKIASIGRLPSGEDDAEGGLAALATYQADAAKFVERVREANAALHDRILTANQARYKELNRAANPDEYDTGVRDLGPVDDDSDDDTFPGGE